VYIILLICIYIHTIRQSLTLISKNRIWLLWSLWLITCIIIDTYKVITDPIIEAKYNRWLDCCW
jgi:hypothetical protein